MLEIRHLRLVRALADEGGPTRAAVRLHLTQSAVSHQLAELEGRLGVVLFARVRRRLVPTPAGARLVQEARALLSELTRIEKDLHRAGERKREALRIVVESFTSYHWLPAVVAALAQEAPHVDVRIALEARREPVAALQRGTVDVALVSSPVNDSALVGRPLFDDEWAVVVAPDHPLARRKYVRVRELGEEMLLVQDATRADAERLRDLVRAERAQMPRVATIPLTEVLLDFVRARMGIGLISRWAAQPYTARGEVVVRRFTRAGLPERWVAWSRRDRKAGTHVERFVELTREWAAPRSHPGRP
jgi:LysR family transcriptional regulator for metE and metH